MLMLHDSLTRTLKAFPPAHDGPVTMYACGPTVYHYVHIGNLRTFSTVDLLRRYLQYLGREVKLVMNITDVGHMLNDEDVGEDKLVARAAKEGKTPQEIAAFYTKAFFEDLGAIGLEPATIYPRATEHIPEMVAMIEKLIDNGKAYVTDKGDVYYSVASFPDYGKLSGNAVDDLVAGARVEVKEDKRHPADFALWINNPLHVLQWKGPRGIRGYPGWHIECSAMAGSYLGETIDLHAGGEDLKFPHHECEIAQSEGANGVPFSRHWLHVSHLLVEGEKMSRSKGNFYRLEDLISKGYSAAAVKWLLLSAHYRAQLNFTLGGLEAAEKTVAYFRTLAQGLDEATTLPEAETFTPATAQAALEEAMDDDLNVSKALAALHEFAKEANRRLADGKLAGGSAALSRDFLFTTIEEIFGIPIGATETAVPAEVLALADERQAARAEGRWADSDRLRAEIRSLGYVVEDTPQGQKLRAA